MTYDVIIIGGGHAGVEAAAAAARVGAHTALITLQRDALARLSCNPAMGGTAKGQLVREIDALGGLMGIATDRSAIQYRMLNRSKGPAVWSPRAQVDRDSYTSAIDDLFATRYPQVDIIEDEVVNLVVREEMVCGVITASSSTPFSCKCAILCAGTFLHGLTHVGTRRVEEGRWGEKSSNELSEALLRLGFPIDRFKTGTPPRVVADSLDFSQMEKQDSETEKWFFSHETTQRSLPQRSCYRLHSNQASHDIIRTNIDHAPMFNGTIHSTGPRYCPSIEDKVMRFPDKDRHPLVCEPEGLDHPWIYFNGFSSSLPEEVQLKALHQIPGCEEADIARPAYAIEYDMVPPHEIHTTLETKRIKGLYFAGQVNGTSGYEEAGIQGLLAGANAALSLQGRPTISLQRDQAYGGVLVDDLVTLHPKEPYRMFTSRAEFRLLLRQDNAEERLHEVAYHSGLISEERYEVVRRRIAECSRWRDRLKRIKFPKRTFFPEDREPDTIETAEHYLKRPNTTFDQLVSGLPDNEDMMPRPAPEIERFLEIEVRYEGYLERERRTVQRLHEQESKRFPSSFDFDNIPALSAESRIRLKTHKPETLGQASRIAGVTPSDLAILLVALKKGTVR